MRLISNAELDEEKKRKENEDIELKPHIVTGLLGYLDSRWEEAKQAKLSIELQMLKNLRQVNGIYDPTKLVEIQNFSGSEAFTMVTNTKCKDALAWIKEMLMQPGKKQKPWGLAPTPLPEMPAEIMEAIVSQVRDVYIQKAVQEAYAQGTPLSIDMIEDSVQEDFPEIRDKIQQEIKRKSKESAEKMEEKIDDQLTEGGFYEALEDALFDLIVFKAAIIKGPVYRKVKRRVRELDTTKGGWTSSIKEEIIATYERRSPFDIYPAPDSTGIDDGYLFDKISMTPMELQNLIGVKGFNEKEIKKILEEYREGGLHEWTAIDSERIEAEEKTPQAITDSAKIDCLEFHGFIQGFILKNYGISVEDGEIWYAVTIWRIGDHIIKAMLNPDDLGKKPYSMTGLEEKPDSFWKKGLPEVIVDIQNNCNAATRHLINNLAMASGPITETNVDKLADGEDGSISPWKNILSTDRQMSETPALKVHNIPMRADQFINSLELFTKQADEQSGIPAYAHGDTHVGGAGSTSSGLHMLMSSAARGIRAIVGNIDKGIIKPVIEKQYYSNINFGVGLEMMPDVVIVAKGSSAVLEKEQMALRMNELLTASNNPVDNQIMPLEGRKYAYEQYAKALNLDEEKLFPDVPQQPANPQDLEQLAKDNPAMFQAMTGGSPKKPMTQDLANKPASGTSERLFGREGK